MAGQFGIGGDLEDEDHKFEVEVIDVNSVRIKESSHMDPRKHIRCTAL